MLLPFLKKSENLRQICENGDKEDSRLYLILLDIIKSLLNWLLIIQILKALIGLYQKSW